MITTAIILAYIISIFIARYLNKRSYEINDKCTPIWVGFWFIPIVNVVFFLSVTVTDYIKGSIKGNWFTGKNW